MAMNFLKCKRNKRDRWIPVKLNEPYLREKNLLMERLSARLTDNGNLFICGAVRKIERDDKTDSKPVIIHCDIQNSNGDILFPVTDPHPKNMELNPYETFYLAVYHISRFLDPAEISNATLYCQYADESLL